MSYIYNLGLYFDKIAEEFNEKTALKYPQGTTYSYKVLQEKSNQLAHWLTKAGIRRGQVIAIFNYKSVESFALMLASLKIGVIYTNLDVSSPIARLSKMIDRCRPKAIFFDSTQSQKEFSGLEIPTYALQSNEVQNEVANCLTAVPPEITHVHADQPAYIMFTSGSTGFPKGAVISHQNLLNFIHWGQETFAVSENDTFTNVNPVYFDNSVFDFYVSLFSGATLVPVSVDDTKNGRKLIQIVEHAHCTIWFSVPSLLVYLLTTKALEEGKLSSLRKVIFGGEGFPKPKLKKLWSLLGNTATLYNVYGPTECTCICSSYIISEKDFNTLQELAPLGTIAANFDYFISAEAEEKETVKKGELCLMGPNVGWGYYNDHERTQKSFLESPVEKGFVQKIYRTGDLVEEREDGLIYILGRVDNQIKHMGYRIELEEVEAAINTLDGIKESSAIYHIIRERLGKIVAFIASDGHVEEKEVLDQLSGILPAYMMPASVKVMGQLPKNANGKIDRAKLKELV
uniref:Amino acid adenylation domain-containing protein n=1 Tax=Roseihalotalea indica TaxID=2867963 RepID=A0AA49JDN0_9BACT|nr:amino acid adenylation domain-containing protein [Tunicatimonas sp. TK19036]